MRGTPPGQKSPGLLQPAGHMTASDPRTARHITSCTAGGHPHMRRRDCFPLLDGGLIGGRLWSEVEQRRAILRNLFGVPPT
jgi:hypothetical protein